MKLRLTALVPIIALAAALPVSAASTEKLEAQVSSALQEDNSQNLEKAVARLKKADPSNPVLARGLVRLVGMGDDSLTYEALSTLNAAIDENPEDASLKRTRALFIVSAPWQRLALADLEEVIASEDPGAAALQAFVDAAAANDRTDLGEARISELLGKNRDPGLLRARADIRYIRGDLKGALEDLEEAAAVSPATLEDHLLRYRIHSQQGEVEAALGDVDSMRRILPLDRGLMRMQAALLVRLGRHEEAHERLLEANE